MQLSAHILTPHIDIFSTNFPLTSGLVQVGEGERGYLLELLLTKLRYAAVSPDPEAKPDATHEGLQIVGMSATMPNVSAVAQWLGAQLFQTDFRSTLYISLLMRDSLYIIAGMTGKERKDYAF